jgi:hypothetical protein
MAKPFSTCSPSDIAPLIHIRVAVAPDARAACEVLRRSMTELCAERRPDTT